MVAPTIVHRYAFPIREAIEALLGEAAGDADAWQLRVEGEQLVIDVVSPSIAPTQQEIDEGRDLYAAPSNEPAKSNVAPDEPELKGGPLATRAAIACTERGFWTFVGASNADDAKAFILLRCGIDSRRKLDHDDGAGAAWREIDSKYRLWLDGHEVEI